MVELAAQLSLAILRVCRVIVSIRMQTQGMTIDEATKFFKEDRYEAPWGPERVV
jgi:hypothetical protein